MNIVVFSHYMEEEKVELSHLRRQDLRLTAQEAREIADKLLKAARTSDARDCQRDKDDFLSDPLVVKVEDLVVGKTYRLLNYPTCKVVEATYSGTEDCGNFLRYIFVDDDGTHHNPTAALLSDSIREL